MRSWRLMLPILATLLLGLDLTAAFAALAVGTINLVSVAFAVLHALGAYFSAPCNCAIRRAFRASYTANGTFGSIVIG